VRVYEALLGSEVEMDRSMASLGLAIVKEFCNLCRNGVSPAQFGAYWRGSDVPKAICFCWSTV